jgi:peroxiredoxin
MLKPGVGGPRLVLPSLDGGGVEIGSGPMLLAFFKVSCPTCQLTFPFLQRFAANPASPPTIGISQDGPSLTRDFNRKCGVEFPTLLDARESEYRASNSYGISYVPSLFLLGEGGEILWTSEGFSKADLEHLASRFGFELFGMEDRVPAYKPG